MSLKMCPVCSTKKWQTLYVVHKYEIVKCNVCSFVFVTNPPAKKQLEAFYSKKDINHPEIIEKIIREDAIRSLEYIEQSTNDRDIFDVGCGRGYFLDEARKRNWKVSGIDYSQEVVTYANNTYKLNIEQGDILKLKPEELYSVITLHQVIEHFTEPRQLINSCKNNLRENGLLYIATPNIESLSSKLYKEKFDYIIPPEHLSYFSISTLSTLLKQCGFKILNQGTWSYTPEFAGIIKYYVNHAKGSRHQESKDVIRNKSVSSRPSHTVHSQQKFLKQIKKLIFDDIFCATVHPVIDLFDAGSMLHIIAQKV